jgi:hypothetical protein
MSQRLKAGQRSLLAIKATIQKRNVRAQANDRAASFSAQDLVKIVIDDGSSSYLLLYRDEWGNAAKPAEHIRVEAGDLGIVIGPVHKSNIWSCDRCYLTSGDPASRRHYRMALFQGIPRAIPICRLVKVVE